MMGEDAAIFRPRHLNEMLSLYSRYPEALLLAGGSSGRPQSRSHAECIIDLSSVQELRKIRRTERFLDIGPCLSLTRILSTGRHIIPKVLYNAISEVASPSVRNLATLGGNICSASAYSCPLPALYALETRLELRTASENRWLPISRLITGDGQTGLRTGEVLTSIRVPFGDWNVGIFKKISTQSSLSPPALTFCGLARLVKEEIQDVRIAFGSVNRIVIRNRKLETPLVGHKIPLSQRDIDGLVSELSPLLAPISDSRAAAEYRARTAVRMLRWFCEELNRHHIYSF